MDYGRVTEKLNVEHPTFNIEWLMEVYFSFEVGRSMFNVRRSFIVYEHG